MDKGIIIKASNEREENSTQKDKGMEKSDELF
jgi:hypothetical protein